MSTATLAADVPPTTSPTTAPLTLADRCDASAVVADKGGKLSRGACGAQAFARVTVPSGAELLFCGHHVNENRAAIIGSGCTLDDQTSMINTKPGEAPTSA